MLVLLCCSNLFLRAKIFKCDHTFLRVNGGKINGLQKKQIYSFVTDHILKEIVFWETWNSKIALINDSSLVRVELPYQSSFRLCPRSTRSILRAPMAPKPSCQHFQARRRPGSIRRLSPGWHRELRALLAYSAARYWLADGLSSVRAIEKWDKTNFTTAPHMFRKCVEKKVK